MSVNSNPAASQINITKKFMSFKYSHISPVSLTPVTMPMETNKIHQNFATVMM
jgi:hypothetical protein